MSRSLRASRILTPTFLLAGLLAWAGPGSWASPASVQAQLASDSYRLAETWQDRPAPLEFAGLPDTARDVTVRPDGSRWVLSGRQIVGFGASGTLVGRIEMVDGGEHRIDAGPDGSIFVLLHLAAGSFVRRYDPAGKADFFVGLPQIDPRDEYRDIAVGPDGGFYLSRSEDHGFLPSSIDRYGADGGIIERWMLTEDIVAGEPYIRPYSLDVGPDGRVYVAFVLALCCQEQEPQPTPTPTPTRPSEAPQSGPEATPARATPSLAPMAAPSSARRGERLARFEPMQDPPPRHQVDIQPMPAGSGLLEIGPDGAFRRSVMAALVSDVAAGPSGVFIVDHWSVHQIHPGQTVVDRATPDYEFIATRQRGPERYWPIPYMDHARLAPAPDGSLQMAVNACFFDGLVDIGHPDSRFTEPRLVARRSLVGRGGPYRPLAMDRSGDRLTILQGHFGIDAASGERVLRNRGDSAAVQLWGTEGDYLDDRLLCSWLAETTVDIAADGGVLYHVSPHAILQRPDALMPSWIYGDPGAQFGASAAADGQLVVLDRRARRILHLDEQGGVLDRIRIDTLDPRAVLDDLAFDGRRIYAADIGRDRVAIYDLQAGTWREFATHDGPRALALGEDDRIFVLGRGGWGLRYDDHGQLEAVWALPRRKEVEATDIALLPGDRPVVSFLGIEPNFGTELHSRIAAAGAWLFEPALMAPGDPPRSPSGICLVDRDKRAQPARLPLGGEVEVSLSVEGSCPRRMAPHQVVFVLDTSWSMSWDDSLERAREAMLALLASMDPWVGQVGLVTFNDGAALAQPLSGDLAAMQAFVSAVQADGDTRYGAGIELARLELEGSRGNPDAQRTIVVVTDGGVKDDPGPDIAAARAAGIEFLVLAYPNSFPAPGILQLLTPFFGDPGRILFDIGPGRIEQTAERLRDWIEMPGLFETIEIRDEIPPAFELVPGSIDPPPARVDGRTITWQLGPVDAADPPQLGYRLTALEVGWHDTNVFADADYRDVLGNAARFDFPIPRVEVFVPTITPTPTQSPTPTATPTPSRTATPLVYRSYLPILLRERQKDEPARADIVLVIDRSSSMRGAKLEAAKAAAARFVEVVDLGPSRVAILQFDATVEPLSELSTDAGSLHSALDRLTSGSGTRIDRAVDGALALLAERPDASRAAVIVLLTDGLQVGEPESLAGALTRLEASGAQRFAIGLGTDLDAALLRDLAGAADRFLVAPGAEDLRAIYESIARAIPCAAADYWGRRC